MKQTALNKEILDYLNKNRIVNLNIIGYIENNPSCEIYVPNSGAEGGVIVRRENDSFFASVHCESFVAEFLESLPLGEKRFCGVEQLVAQRLIKVIKERYVFNEDWVDRCNTYALTGKHIRGADGGYKCTPLTLDDAEEVNRFYTYKSDTSINRIIDNISKRDSSCIRINGELATWVTVHNDGSMGILYVKEKFRGMQLGRIVTEDLIEKLLAKGKIPFVQIVYNNTNSHNLVKKIAGMEFSHVCEWIGMTKVK